MKYELKVLNKKLVMDSREIAELTHKQHSKVLRDIRSMYNNLYQEKSGNPKMDRQNKIPNPLTYKDCRGKLQPYYLLTYEDTLLLLTGYSITLRQAVIKRWLYLESSYRKERQQSIEIKNNFTDELKNRGYNKSYEYIQTTKQMKDTLFIKNKKEAMTERELKAVRTSEALAELLFDNEYGYNEINPICIRASKIISSALDNNNKKLITTI